MPEAPDLEVIKEFLEQRVVGARVGSCQVLRPTVVRSLTGELTIDLPGRTLESIQRQGKFLTIGFTGERSLVVNPMLTGALQYCQAGVRVQKKTCLVVRLEDGQDLRYLDDRQMGKVYFLEEGQQRDVPQYDDRGPDVLSGISLEEFQERLKKFQGEIKGVLTRGSCR